jgi:hypothetical protein
MKLILLLSVLCFATAFAGDYIVTDMYAKSGCKDADLVVHLNSLMKLGCKKFTGGGSADYKLDGKKIVADSYTTTDCSGTKAATTDTGLVTGTCVAQGSSSVKIGTMSASVWKGHTTGAGNIFMKNYEGSETCGGDVSMEMVYLSKAQGICMPRGGGSETATWTTTAVTSKEYGSTDCTGTATKTEVENFNVCTNTTTANGKSSGIASANPAVSSGTKLTGFTSTLFLLCVALFTNSFL